MIKVEHLTKYYGDFLAVDDLSFEIDEGHVYGFLGPNGAGKSTTMNIMTGCLSATSGRVSIGGFDIFEEADSAKRLIGYLPEQPPLYMNETPLEYLRFVGEAKGLRGEELNAQIESVIHQVRIKGVKAGGSPLFPRATNSAWALPRHCWGIRRSSFWMSPPWVLTPCRSSRYET